MVNILDKYDIVAVHLQSKEEFTMFINGYENPRKLTVTNYNYATKNTVVYIKYECNKGSYGDLTYFKKANNTLLLTFDEYMSLNSKIHELW